MERLERLFDLGKTLGYEGAELRELIAEREQIERDERWEDREANKLYLEAKRESKQLEAERESKQLEAERESKQLEAERESKRLEAERESKQLEAEREAKKLEIEAQVEAHKLEADLRKEDMKLKYDLETMRSRLESGRSRADSNIESGDNGGSFRAPKLPCFVEGKDNIDSYLARFETYAISTKWPRESYSLCLSALLTGNALDVLAKVPQASANDYDYLKRAC